MLPDSVQVTTLLVAYRQGDPAAGNQLVATLYDELHRLAGHYLRQERSHHTLQPTALVHELYLRLFASEPIEWQNRAHFFAVAAKTLRRILVDHARAHRTKKRGEGQVKLSLTAANGWAEAPRQEDLLAVDEALARLAEFDPRLAQVVELRFFGGLQENEVAEVLGVAPITVKRDWKTARAWLLSQLLPSRRPQPD